MIDGRARSGDQWARVVVALLPVLLVAVGLEQVAGGREGVPLLVPAVLVVGTLTAALGRWPGLAGVVAAVAVAFGLRPQGAPAALVLLTGAAALVAWAAVSLVNSRRPATAVVPVMLLAVAALLLGLSGQPQALLLMAGITVSVALLLLVAGSWTGAGEGHTAAVLPTARSVAWSGAAMVLVGIVVLSAGVVADVVVPRRTATVSVAPEPDTPTAVVMDVRDPLTEATRWQTQPSEASRSLLTLLPPVADDVRPVWLSMTEYNGAGWVAPVFFRPAPGTIPPEPGVVLTRPLPLSARLQVDTGLPGPWVPVPQRVTQVLGGNAPRYNLHSGVIATVSSPIGGAFQVSYVQPQVTDAQLARVAPLTVPGDPAVVLPGALPPSLTVLRAEVVTESGSSTWARLTGLSEALRASRFEAAPASELPPQGPGRTLQDLGAVVESGRGFQEQYAAAFAVIARSWGVPTRLCIGFLPEIRKGGTTVLGADTSVWVEARLSGTGWVAFQPSPQDREAGRPAVVRPPSPSVNPSASSSAVPSASPRPGASGQPDEAGQAAASTVLPWLAGASVLLVAWVAWVATRRHRRRASLRAGSPRVQTAGAWVWARDCIEEARLPLASTATPDRVADPGDRCADDLPDRVAEPLRALAALCSRALYAPADGPLEPGTVEQAWEAAAAVEEAAAASSGSRLAGVRAVLRRRLVPMPRDRWRDRDGGAASLGSTVVGRAPRDS